jgi:hypothetical protein
MKIIFMCLLAILPQCSQAEVRARYIELKHDQVATVKTAIGIATIIQLPERPHSVIVGDQDAFKVEYLDKAITVKPLHSRGSTNLYLYTDWRRYDVQLTVTTPASADYVVYLLEKKASLSPQSTPLRWHIFKEKITTESFQLETDKVSWSPSSGFVLHFTISSKVEVKFDPAWIWLTQKGSARPIQRLSLTTLQIAPHLPVKGSLHLLPEDIDPKEKMRLEVRNSSHHYLTIPKAALWK